MDNTRFIPLGDQEVRKDLLRTYVAIVLDKSGSMDKIRDATIQGFNGQVDSIIKDAVGQTFLSLVSFSTYVEPVFWNQHPSYLTKLSRDNYKPSGNTALYDAIGHTIRRLEFTAEDVGNSAFLIIIVSDGYENWSKEYKHTLPNLIKEKQATGRWTFVYVGSNQDIAQVAQTLWIPTANAMSFTNDWHGTAAAFTVTNNSLGSYFNDRKRGVTSSSSFYGNDPNQLNVVINNATNVVPPPAPTVDPNGIVNNNSGGTTP